MIINVGRQLGSGGRIIGKHLAEAFDCRFCDRVLLNLAAAESGFSERFFERSDEHKNFFGRFFNIATSHVSSGNFYSSKLSQESLFKFQSDAIRKAAEEGPCVFVGRCADYVLRERKDMVNIFITANMEDRIKLTCSREEMDEAAAKRFIEKIDTNRAAYYNYYTGKRWGYAASYDITINSSILGIEGTTEYLKTFIKQRFK